jgi:hypothetical protein
MVKQPVGIIQFYTELFFPDGDSPTRGVANSIDSIQEPKSRIFKTTQHCYELVLVLPYIGHA